MGVPAVTPAPAPADPGGTAPAPVPAPAPAAQPFSPDTLSPEAKAYVAQQVADANHKARTVARGTAAKEAQDAVLATIAQALGQDTPTDPAQLTTQLSQQATANKTLAVQNALLGAAYRGGADGDLMVAVLTYNGKLSQLDPAAPDFGAQVSALVASELAANPRLALVQGAPAAAPAAGGASAPSMGNGAPTNKITLEQLQKMSPADIAAAHERGELKHLM